MKLEAIRIADNMVLTPDHFSSNGRKRLGTVSFPLQPSGVGICDEVIREMGTEIYAKQISNKKLTPPSDNDVKGVMVVVFTEIERRPHILMQEEQKTNFETGKRKGDYSVVAETRHKGEDLNKTVKRGLKEETGFDPSLFKVSPVYGFCAISGEEEFADKITWVRTHHAFIDYNDLSRIPFTAKDRETNLHVLTHPLIALGAFPVRAGINSVISHWLKGRNDSVIEGSPARRDTEVIYKKYE